MIILAEKVVKTYEARKVLDIEYFGIEKPGVYSLLGPNGAGKTTFFNIITGLVKPDTGRILVKDGSIEDRSVRKIIGYCTQEYGLIDLLSGLDNALFYGRLYGLSEEEIKTRLIEMSEKLGLTSDDLRRKVGKYSGGMKRKLSLIVSLIHNPEIAILDEPTTGLDPAVRRDVWTLINDYRKQGKTLLIATHHMEEADILSDRVYIINQGKIIAEGTPEELKERYGPKTIVELVFEQSLTSALSTVLIKFSDKYIIDGSKARIHIEQPERTIPVLISELYQKGLRVIEFRMAKPTLEDVFLRLTGRRLIEP